MGDHAWFDVEKGSQPWARDHADEMPCPFCGGRALKQSFGDDDDQVRVELYCDNVNCEVREMTVLARRVDAPLERADVQALDAVDSYGFGGGPQRAGDLLSGLQRSAEIRRRPARTTVEPL
jgi:hypothetical protein